MNTVRLAKCYKLEFELNRDWGTDLEPGDEEMMEKMYQNDEHRNDEFAKL